LRKFIETYALIEGESDKEKKTASKDEKKGGYNVAESYGIRSLKFPEVNRRDLPR
jgi:hypothetical protein